VTELDLPEPPRLLRWWLVVGRDVVRLAGYALYAPVRAAVDKIRRRRLHGAE
jgi:hypothetical protein